MANPTTYFGWVMPNSADLVTDLPADFNVFGQGVDTSMQDLLGGTTGQVLSKTSATNMDFTWVTPTDQTPLTTKGDLFTFTTVDARLGVGTNGQTLVANSSTATGLEWQTPAGGGGKVLQVVFAKTVTYTNMNSTTYADTTLTATITPTLNTSKILVLVNQNGCGKEIGNIATTLHLKLLRGSTDILLFGDVFGVTNSSLDNSGLSVGASFLDSPATTSATTYKTQMKSQVSGQNVKTQNYISSQNTNSTIVLMEIGV